MQVNSWYHKLSTFTYPFEFKKSGEEEEKLQHFEYALFI